MEFTTLKRGSAAFLLSLLTPSLGQIYNGQLKKALLLFPLSYLWLLIGRTIGLPYTFGGFLVLLMVALGISVFILTEAVRTAIRQARADVHPVRRWHSYVIGVVLLGITLTAGKSEQVAHIVSGVHAYKIPSESMDPTLIRGDHLIADPRAFERAAPKRGDLVIIDAPGSRGLWVKRVIAVGGDVIEGSPSEVLVNGKPLHEAYLRQASSGEEILSDPHDTYGPLKVPENQLFLLGDNRLHSYDSRQPEFGTISVTRLKGRPLFLYWSPKHDRIGKKLE